MELERKHVILRSLEQYRVYLLSKQKEQNLPFTSSVLRSEISRVEQAMEEITQGIEGQEGRVKKIQQKVAGLKNQPQESVQGITPDLRKMEVRYQSPSSYILTVDEKEILTTRESRVVARVFTSLML